MIGRSKLTIFVGQILNSVVAIFWDGRCKFKKIGGPIASLYEEPSNSIEKNKGRCAHVHELKLIEEKNPKGPFRSQNFLTKFFLPLPLDTCMEY